MSKMKNLSTVEKLMDGFNPYRQRQEETRGLVKKWEPTGLLEGINEEQRVHGMAVLLENQARQLIDELVLQVHQLILKNGLVLLYHW